MQHERPAIGRSKTAHRWLALLVVAAPVSACVGQEAEREPAGAACEMRIIVGLESEPDETLLAALAVTARARLELVGEVTSRLHVLNLRADGTDAECGAAIERLRTDPRVRSVDIDARREAHPQ